jgi:heme/copper-type cytochrome/quinol oxidase subunit 3
MESPVATTRSATGINTGVLALYWVIISEIVIFGGLIMCYLLFRLRNDHWGEFAAVTSTPAGALNTFVLLTSSYFAVIAHDAATKKDGDKAFRFLWYTIGCGLIFLIVKSYEYSSKLKYLFADDGGAYWDAHYNNNFMGYYFFATGLHGLHVIAGMVAMIIVSKQVKRGQNFNRVELCGLYWHFVDIVWIFLFPLLYIAK